MASSTLLTALKKPQLRAAALLMGLPSSGNMAELRQVIQQSAVQREHDKERSRIVSVDMGIKNLGICVLEARQPARPTGPRNQQHSPSPHIKLVKWQTINVLDKLHRLTLLNRGLVEIHVEVSAKSTAVNAKTFRPSALSIAALDLAKYIWAFEPSHILIENQRFRSGGGAAVQEWTLRVNALESMLWACFQTLRDANAERSPEVHEISPKQVANFWCSRPYGLSSSVSDDLFSTTWKTKAEDEKEIRRTVDKKEKIALARSWLSSEELKPHEDVAPELSTEVQSVADAFLKQGRKTPRKKSESSPSSPQSLGKLDDLADCLLQGVAWVRWENNRRKIRAMLEDLPEPQKSLISAKRKAE